MDHFDSEYYGDEARADLVDEASMLNLDQYDEPNRSALFRTAQMQEAECMLQTSSAMDALPLNQKPGLLILTLQYKLVKVALEMLGKHCF